MPTRIRCAANWCSRTTKPAPPPTDTERPAQEAHATLKATQALEFTAPRDDNARLANLCGPLDENLRQIEQALDVT
ncbi:hypothetical protein ACS0Y0_26815, partial [Burkholderia gladioli]